MKQLYFLKYGFLLCLVVSSITVFAQTGNLSGIVRDEANQPLPGATVALKGSSRSTSTDANGAYSLSGIPEGAQTVVVTFIGYEDVTSVIKVSGNTKADFSLKPSSTSLAQVVVVGYGTQKRKDVTGSVSTLTANDLNPGPVTSPLQQIAGRAAGVNVSQTGSEPGSSPSVRIRGIGSLIGGNDPLVVVDGIQGNMDLFNQVPPSEIESVDILKDASATAIYGSRGAPGVIIVTTKKSKSGTTTVEYNATSSLDLIVRKLDVLDANEWWTQAQLYGVPASANHGSNTDWYNILTRNGSTQNHNLSIGGGTDNFNYRASLNAITQQGIVIRSNNQNYIGRIQATQKALNNKLTVSMNLNSSVINKTASPNSVGTVGFTSNLISNAYVSRPTDPVFNTDGTYFTDANVFQYINPYAVSQTVVSEGNTNNLFGSLRADLEIARGLTAGAFGSWRKVDNTYGYYLPAVSTVTLAIDNKGVANIRNDRQNERLMDLSLNYKKSTGKHSFDILGVYEWQNQSYQGNFAQAKGFINDIASYNALQLGDLSRVQPGDFSSYKNDRTLVSFLGRLNYSFLNRYLLTASFRRDGSSVFGANHKWGNFPSASLAWRIDQEPFMANQKLFNSLKLRGGYGITGNQQGLFPQSSLQLVGYAGQTYFGGSQITNYAISQNQNPDLKWETKYQTNIGIDFSILESRLSGTFDAYTATTKNLLFDYTVPQPPYPFGSVKANVGSVLNRGLEASLSYQLIKNKNTMLVLAANGSLLKNKVLNLSGSINGVPLNTNYVGWGPNSFLIEGKPIGSFNILQHSGKDENNKETVTDQNGDGTIDQGARSPDRVLEGSALPTYTYAFTPSFTYKNFDASMVWRGSGGNKIYNGIRQTFSMFENLGKSNLLKSAVPLGIYTTEYGSDLWLEDGSFLRFENLTMGYRFNVSKIKYVSGLRVSLTANNLALFTKYSGLDPELNVSGGNGFGGDYGIYPRTTSIAIGLNVNLK
ncbi:SusC/RagA family TonB-linked outer membrane protein [Rubrolithibacter danxiaensis]|uniref:SusC/RagA family TonB-linked outer membrane protein n=1 Tax=Rubrolithibacter danxiaensis TaxID=3390805 RepID=UPI003BF8F5C8